MARNLLAWQFRPNTTACALTAHPHTSCCVEVEATKAVSNQRMHENTSQNRTKFWCAVRIENFRLQFLDQNEEWADPTSATLVSSDRETVFQAGRRNGGLLMNIDGLPGPKAWDRFRAFVADVRIPAGTADDAEGEDLPASVPQGGNGTKPPRTAEETAAEAKARKRAEREKCTGQTEAPY